MDTWQAGTPKWRIYSCGDVAESNSDYDMHAATTDGKHYISVLYNKAKIGSGGVELVLTLPLADESCVVDAASRGTDLYVYFEGNYTLLVGVGEGSVARFFGPPGGTTLEDMLFEARLSPNN